MALYKLVISKQVRKKDFKKIPKKARLQAVKAFESLISNPRPAQAIKLTNREEYRLRIGVYRILYVINDKKKIVSVRKVQHRGEVYK